MGLWTGIADAETFERGRYMHPGFKGVVRITKTLVKNTRKSGTGFIVELLVVSTNMPSEKDGHPVGSKATWFQKLTDQQVAFPAVKAFVAACMGFELHQKAAIKAEVDPVITDLLDYATAPGNETDNELIGIDLNLETVRHTTQKGQIITLYDFTPYNVPTES